MLGNISVIESQMLVKPETFSSYFPCILLTEKEPHSIPNVIMEKKALIKIQLSLRECISLNSYKIIQYILHLHPESMLHLVILSGPRPHVSDYFLIENASFLSFLD